MQYSSFNRYILRLISVFKALVKELVLSIVLKFFAKDLNPICLCVHHNLTQVPVIILWMLVSSASVSCVNNIAVNCNGIITLVTINTNILYNDLLFVSDLACSL